MEILLGFVGMAGMLGVAVGYVAAQASCIRRWAGSWRLAAALPLAGWAVWGEMLAHDLGVDPTSHNLFPFEIMLGVVGALAYLGLLAVTRRLLAKA